MRQIVGNGAEGRLARGWGVVGLQYFGELDVQFLKFSYGMTQSSEAVGIVGRCCVVGLVHLSIIVGVGIIDERGQEACSAGVRKGISGRLLEFGAEGFPFLKEGGGRCRIPLRGRNGDGIVIVVE